MTEEDEAFNEIERQAKQRKEAVRAAMRSVEEDDDIQIYQRPWVGLTDKDKHEIELRAGITEDDDGYIVSQVFKLTEAKLKELNT